MILHSTHNVLAFDTATGGIYIALQVSDGSIKTAYDAGPYGQAEILMPMIDKLIQDCGIRYGDLDTIITTNGPGTFTGLRIGLSTAISLGQSLDIPVHAVSCFEAYAAHFYQDQNHSRIRSAVIIESKRDDFYIEIFDGQGQAKSLAGLYDGDQASQLFGSHRTRWLRSYRRSG